jgi:hypothetical protein
MSWIDRIIEVFLREQKYEFQQSIHRFEIEVLKREIDKSRKNRGLPPLDWEKDVVRLDPRTGAY